MRRPKCKFFRSLICSESFKEDYIYNKGYVLKTHAQTSAGQDPEDSNSQTSTRIKGNEANQKRKVI